MLLVWRQEPERKDEEMTDGGRMTTLLINAAKCFRECYSPFSHEELSKMEVTSEECYQLSVVIADAIENFVEHYEEVIENK